MELRTKNEVIEYCQKCFPAFRIPEKDPSSDSKKKSPWRFKTDKIKCPERRERLKQILTEMLEEVWFPNGDFFDMTRIPFDVCVTTDMIFGRMIRILKLVLVERRKSIPSNISSQHAVNALPCASAAPIATGVGIDVENRFRRLEHAFENIKVEVENIKVKIDYTDDRRKKERWDDVGENATANIICLQPDGDGMTAASSTKFSDKSEMSMSEFCGMFGSPQELAQGLVDELYPGTRVCYSIYECAEGWISTAEVFISPFFSADSDGFYPTKKAAAACAFSKLLPLVRSWIDMMLEEKECDVISGTGSVDHVSVASGSSIPLDRNWLQEILQKKRLQYDIECTYEDQRPQGFRACAKCTICNVAVRTNGNASQLGADAAKSSAAEMLLSRLNLWKEFMSNLQQAEEEEEDNKDEDDNISALTSGTFDISDAAMSQVSASRSMFSVDSSNSGQHKSRCTIEIQGICKAVMSYNKSSASSGPPHVSTASITWNALIQGKGHGSRKKEAEAMATWDLLSKLRLLQDKEYMYPETESSMPPINALQKWIKETRTTVVEPYQCVSPLTSGTFQANAAIKLTLTCSERGDSCQKLVDSEATAAERLLSVVKRITTVE
jgi:hypothetical protein